MLGVCCGAKGSPTSATASGIDRNLAHQRQVDHHAVVAQAQASYAVAAAMDGKEKPAISGEVDRSDDVARGPAAGDKRWAGIDRAVTDRPGFVVAVVI